MKYFLAGLMLCTATAQATVIKEIHIPSAKKGEILKLVRADFKQGKKVCVYRSQGDKFVVSIDRAKKTLTRDCRQNLKAK
ncbi:hypothetical protein [Thalassotalea eurytherma]|uniref:PepSY domain-containing protein n=1 Tax=Thalassotalea eurytherma TaxID=1144278 RepID=A0ABQ6H546_9GAMM|nr:hypothetical protein [Thalassotalea eurytherma]GLX82295.1 hypothetical protein theurythT_17470 [Thalassotalea eurytherma]